jgi:hypothetical protein
MSLAEYDKAPPTTIRQGTNFPTQLLPPAFLHHFCSINELSKVPSLRCQREITTVEEPFDEELYHGCAVV